MEIMLHYSCFATITYKGIFILLKTLAIGTVVRVSSNCLTWYIMYYRFCNYRFLYIIREFQTDMNTRIISEFKGNDFRDDFNVIFDTVLKFYCNKGVFFIFRNFYNCMRFFYYASFPS